MKWTKTGITIAVLAAGWWLVDRAQAAAADGGAPGATRSSSVITPPNPDPAMVKTLPNPDPKMVVNPPWPTSK